jgi:hypothetical protein
MSKLQGILEMPGFNGFPSKAFIENNQQEVSQPVYKFRRYLSNGQMWEHKSALPYNPNFNYPEKYKFAFPQSKTSLDTGFASNPETIMYPNPDAGYKLNPEFKDAYRITNEQRGIAHDKERRERGHMNSEIMADATTNFVKQYMNTAIEAGEGELREKLRLEGFSDEEVNEYIKKRKAEKIDYIAKNINKTDAMVHFMKGFDPDTGMEAAGIGALSGVQSSLAEIHKLLVQFSETPAARKAREKANTALLPGQTSIMGFVKPVASDTASVATVASDPRSVAATVDGRGKKGKVAEAITGGSLNLNV